MTHSSHPCLCTAVPWPPCELFTRCVKCELAATAGRSETCVGFWAACCTHAELCATRRILCCCFRCFSLSFSHSVFLFLSLSRSLSLSKSFDVLRSCTYQANRTSRLTYSNTVRSARTRPSLNTYHTAPSYLPPATHTYTHTFAA